MAARKVAREDAGGKPELRIVRALDDFVLRPEGQDAHDRAEDLLAGDPHVVGDVGEDGRLDEEAVLEALEPGNAAPAQETRALGTTGLDVADDLVVLAPIDERSHLRFPDRADRRADRLGAGGETIEEPVHDAVLDEDAGPVRADLSRRIEVAEHGAADGILDIGVVEDDQRRLAAEFHGRMLHLRASEREHLAPRGHGPGERDLGDRRMAGEHAADIAETLDDIEETIGKAASL